MRSKRIDIGNGLSAFIDQPGSDMDKLKAEVLTARGLPLVRDEHGQLDVSGLGRKAA